MYILMDVKKTIYIILGFVFFVLAVIGTILPVMPTIPFLLAAAFCFSRGSKRFDNWFKSTKLYQHNLADFVQGDGMTIYAKLRIMFSLSFLFIFGFIIMGSIPIARMIIVVVWLAHILYFTFKVKTKQNERQD